MPIPAHALTAILPCNDVAASEAFYGRLGFRRPGPLTADAEDYVILSDGKGAHLHLRRAEAGWLTPGSNPNGVYLYTDEVDALAARFLGLTIEPGGPEHKPWGMYEFSLSDPDQTLVRVGWPSELIRARRAD
jgi:catechol 2,3-dioxygenase-like lactoylglutathione lyase family enzyme